MRNGSSSKDCGRARSAQHAVDEVGQTATRVDQLELRQPHRHRVDRKIAAGQITLEGIAVDDLRLARRGHVGIRPIGRHLDHYPRAGGTDRPELLADIPHRVAPLVQEGHGRIGTRRRREIKVMNCPAKKGIANRTSNECQFVSRTCENRSQFKNCLRQIRQGTVSLDEKPGTLIQISVRRCRKGSGIAFSHSLRVPENMAREHFPRPRSLQVENYVEKIPGPATPGSRRRRPLVHPGGSTCRSSTRRPRAASSYRCIAAMPT